ncbi:hypothetical protein DFJ74DRAFT_211222 [Hyaloraphidium curvatum]|nr:hypothetical protein DFJ74DRAFT_211222 [Hyaloraphidium curvatum]
MDAHAAQGDPGDAGGGRDGFPPTPAATPRAPLSASAAAARLARRKRADPLPGADSLHGEDSPDGRGTPSPPHTPFARPPAALQERSPELDPASPLSRKYLASLRRLADVERNLDASEDHVGQVTRELQSLKGDLARKRKEIAELTAAKDELAARTVELEHLVAELQSSKSAAHQQLASSRAQLRSAAERLAASDAEVQSSRAELDCLRTRVASLERGNDEAVKQIQEFSDLFRDVQAERNHKDAVIAGLNDSVARLTEEIGLLRRSTAAVEDPALLEAQATQGPPIEERVPVPPSAPQTLVPAAPAEELPAAEVLADASGLDEHSWLPELSFELPPRVSDSVLGDASFAHRRRTSAAFVLAASPVEALELSPDVPLDDIIDELTLEDAGEPLVRTWTASSLGDDETEGVVGGLEGKDGPLELLLVDRGRTSGDARLRDRPVALIRQDSIVVDSRALLPAGGDTLLLYTLLCVSVSLLSILAAALAADEPTAEHGYHGLPPLLVAARHALRLVNWAEGWVLPAREEG